MKDFERNWDAHETGHIELSGMTWYEYTEWALQQENNVQPSKFDNDETRIYNEIRGREVQTTLGNDEKKETSQRPETEEVLPKCKKGLHNG